MLYTTSQEIDTRLRGLGIEDKNIDWTGLIKGGINNTEEGLKKHPEKPKTRVAAFAFVAFIATIVLLYLTVTSVIDFRWTFKEYMDDGAAIKDNAPQAIREKIDHARNVFTASLFGMIVPGMLAAFNANAYWVARREYKRRPSSLALSAEVEYTAKAQASDDGFVIVVTRIAPKRYHPQTAEAKDVMRIPVNKNAALAVEELDALMLKLRDLQTKTHQDRQRALADKNIHTAHLQEEFFASLKNKHALTKKADSTQLLNMLNQHAVHHQETTKSLIADEEFTRLVEGSSSAVKTTPQTQSATR